MICSYSLIAICIPYSSLEVKVVRLRVCMLCCYDLFNDITRHTFLENLISKVYVDSRDR